MNGLELESRVRQRINEIRAGKRIYQAQLAEALRISQSSVSALLSGQTSLRLADLKTIACTLGTTVAELLPDESKS